MQRIFAFSFFLLLLAAPLAAQAQGITDPPSVRPQLSSTDGLFLHLRFDGHGMAFDGPKDAEGAGLGDGVEHRLQVVTGVDLRRERGEREVEALDELASEHDAAGVYAFTFDALGADSTLHARCFVPGAGVPEDPVTGTASGACGAYLRHVGAFDDLPDEMTFEQGHFVDQPGLVSVRVGDEVRVGGRAVTTLDGSMAISVPGSGVAKKSSPSQRRRSASARLETSTSRCGRSPSLASA